MPAVTIKADGPTPTKARRRPPRRWSPGSAGSAPRPRRVTAERSAAAAAAAELPPCPTLDDEIAAACGALSYRPLAESKATEGTSMG